MDAVLARASKKSPMKAKPTPMPTPRKNTRAWTNRKVGQTDVYVTVQTIGPDQLPSVSNLTNKQKLPDLEDAGYPTRPSKVAKVVSITHPTEFEPASSLSADSDRSDRSDSDIENMDSPIVPFNICDGFEGLGPIGDPLTNDNISVNDLGLHPPCPSPDHSLDETVSTVSPIMSPSTPQMPPLMMEDVDDDGQVLQHVRFVINSYLVREIHTRVIKVHENS